jgi:hypothetical protein
MIYLSFGDVDFGSLDNLRECDTLLEAFQVALDAVHLNPLSGIIPEERENSYISIIDGDTHRIYWEEEYD